MEGLFLYAIFTVTAGCLSENAVEPPTLVITNGIFEIVQGGEISRQFRLYLYFLIIQSTYSCYSLLIWSTNTLGKIRKSASQADRLSLSWYWATLDFGSLITLKYKRKELELCKKKLFFMKSLLEGECCSRSTPILWILPLDYHSENNPSYLRFLQVLMKFKWINLFLLLHEISFNCCLRRTLEKLLHHQTWRKKELSWMSSRDYGISHGFFTHRET